VDQPQHALPAVLPNISVGQLVTHVQPIAQSVPTAVLALLAIVAIQQTGRAIVFFKATTAVLFQTAKAVIFPRDVWLAI